MKITADTNASEALKMSRAVADIFYKYNLDCPGCRGLKEETIGKIAFNNGLRLEVFLNELNEATKQGNNN